MDNRQSFFVRSAFLVSTVLCSLLLFSCSVSEPEKQDPGKEVLPFSEGIRIGWDFKTLTRMHEGPVFYPRIIRLSNGDLLCAFESERSIYITRSSNNGKTWNEAEQIAPPAEKVSSSVPELIQLQNGRIILAYNTRPPKENANPSLRFGIKTRVSDDGGLSWSQQQNVFEGGYEWERGVWEPAMIQRENGEIQLFFANEYPYEDSNDQEISMVRSHDNGETWSDPETISYRQGHRDGMPVPLILQNNRGIVVAIEDNGLDGETFKPATIHTSMKNNWDQAPVTAHSDGRRRALADDAQMLPREYGGAPYIQQLPSGETLLSFQGTENRPGNWTNSTMIVAIGNDAARNFSRKSRPFDVPGNKSALWNSLFIKNDTTVSAVTSTTAYGSKRQLYMIDGHVNSSFSAPFGQIKVDGQLQENAWKRATTNFLGAHTPAHVKMSAAWDDEHLYLAYRVYDFTRNTNSDQPGGIAVLLAPHLLVSDSLVAGTYKVLSTPSGEIAAYRGQSGTWTTHDLRAEAAFNTHEKGYELEVAVPWSALGGRPAQNKGWGINFELVNYNSSGNSLRREVLSGTEESVPSTWMQITLTK